MANLCPKCGASWNGLQYACGSKDELFTGFVQSEKCLADEQAPEFETIQEKSAFDRQCAERQATVDALAADGKRIFVDEHGRMTPGSAYDEHTKAMMRTEIAMIDKADEAYATALEKVDEAPPMEPVEAVEGE